VILVMFAPLRADALLALIPKCGASSRDIFPRQQKETAPTGGRRASHWRGLMFRAVDG
jgi:hypothetical protein